MPVSLELQQQSSNFVLEANSSSLPLATMALAAKWRRRRSDSKSSGCVSRRFDDSDLLSKICSSTKRRDSAACREASAFLLKMKALSWRCFARASSISKNESLILWMSSTRVSIFLRKSTSLLPDKQLASFIFESEWLRFFEREKNFDSAIELVASAIGRLLPDEAFSVPLENDVITLVGSDSCDELEVAIKEPGALVSAFPPMCFGPVAKC